MGLLTNFKKLDAGSQTLIISGGVASALFLPWASILYYGFALTGGALLVGPGMAILVLGYASIAFLMTSPIWLPVLFIVEAARKTWGTDEKPSVPDVAVMAFKSMDKLK